MAEHSIEVGTGTEVAAAGDTTVTRLLRRLQGSTKYQTVVHVQSGSTPDAELDLRDAAACARVGASMLDAPEPDARQAALELVARDTAVLMSAAASITPLLDDPVWFVRRAAVSAIARLLPEGDVRAQQALIGLLSDSSVDVRIGVMRALEDLDSDLPVEAADVVVRACEDEAWNVRAAAVQLLGELERRRDAPTQPTTESAVAARLHDTASGVRAAALEAIGCLSGGGVEERHAEAVRALTRDADMAVREAAERRLRSFVHVVSL